MASPSQIAVLFIDIQKGFDHPTYWGGSSARSNPNFKENATKVLQYFRQQEPKPLIIHIQHCSISDASPLHPSNPGNAFHDFATPLPHETIMTKDVNSAFIGTNLEAVLRDHKIRKLYILGLTIDQCVSTTVRMAANLRVCDGDGPDEKGEVILIGDAAAAYSYEGLDAELIHRVHETTLGHEFCTVVKTADVLERK